MKIKMSMFLQILRLILALKKNWDLFKVKKASAMQGKDKLMGRKSKKVQKWLWFWRNLRPHDAYNLESKQDKYIYFMIGEQ